MSRILFLLAVLIPAALFADDAGLIKPPPSRPPEGSCVRLTELEVLPDCAENKVCADGIIENVGMKTAYLVRLKVELGGIKTGKPRTYFVQQLPDNEMAPGEKQDINLMIDRKFAYKDAQKKDKVIEVGRYNFKVVPVWASSPTVPKPTPKAVKK